MVRCETGKIINPDSGRCVKKDGKIGKIIATKKLSKSPKKSVKKSPKKSVKKSVKKIPKKSVKKSVKKSPKKSVKKSQSGCTRQKTAKYNSLTRKSPPYPANKCQGKSLIGNDGNMYKSIPNINGIHTWRLKT